MENLEEIMKPNKNEYDGNIDAYKKKFEEGYGVRYPDGHVIRLYHHVLAYDLNIKSGKVFDFGCGNGTHLKFFMDMGFIPYGCDIDKYAIQQAKELMPEYADNFFASESVPDLAPRGYKDFSMVFSNDVLYYLNDQDINHLVSQFYDMLQPGGVFYATMMSPKDWYFSRVESKMGDMSKVVLTGRLNETTYINFKTKEQVLDMFSPFKKLHMGEKCGCIREDEGFAHDWAFLGQK